MVSFVNVLLTLLVVAELVGVLTVVSESIADSTSDLLAQNGQI